MYKKKNDLLTSGIKILTIFGISQSRLETAIFLSFTLNKPREVLPLFTLEVAEYETSKKFFSYIERRTLKEPVAYIKNEKEFFSLPFYVNRNVLIPRNETELIPDYLIRNNLNFSSILEIGVGSGNISITLNYNLSNNNYYGFDISLAALKVSVKNNKILSNGKIHFFQSDLLTKPILKGKDIIISNPPYIKSEDIAFLMDDVKCFEPRLALDGKIDGLYFYREIALYGKKILTQDAKVLVEIGENMSQDVINIFNNHQYMLDEKLVDLANIPRILIFRIKR